MKLYDIPQGSIIYCQVSDDSTWLVFKHLDGSYSYCITENGNVAHLHACQELNQVGHGRYELAQPTSVECV